MGASSRPGPALVCRAARAVAPPSLYDARWALGCAARPRRRRTAWSEVAARSDVDAARLVRAAPGSRRRRRGASRGDARARRARSPDADIVVSDDPIAGARDSDRRLRAAADRRSAHRRRRGRACRLARARGARARRRGRARSRASFGSRAGRSHRRRRTVDRRRAATRSARTCATRSCGRILRRRARALVRDRRAASAEQSVDAGAAGEAPRQDHWFFDGWTAARDQLEAAGVPAAQIHRRRALHGEPPRGVLLVPARRRAGRAHRPPRFGGSERLYAAWRRPSRAFASRSAWAFSERPTCSKVTRPISCASSRAFACSGCSPAFFTL